MMNVPAGWIGIAVLAWTGAASASPAITADSVSAASTDHSSNADSVRVDVALNTVLTDEMNSSIANMSQLEGQTGPLAGRASLDLATCRITVYLPGGFVPSADGGDFEDQLDLLRNGLWWRSMQAGCEGSVSFLFNGFDIDHYFPAGRSRGADSSQGRSDR